VKFRRQVGSEKDIREKGSLKTRREVQKIEKDVKTSKK
jgi:hypothetical protein